jgi:hypothetical protein
MKATADAVLGTAKIADQESMHDTSALAVALVYARTQDPAYRSKAAGGISAAIGTEVGGTALALARNLASYVIAADLIGLATYDPALETRFRSWLSAVRRTDLGGKTLISTHEIRPNNWGTMAGGSRAAADVYLGDTDDLARAAQVFAGWLGDLAAYAGFDYGSDLSWQADPQRPVGINPPGSTIQGFNVDGALPEEMRRGCSFQIPPCDSTAYPWEGLQGAVVQAHILARRGYDTWNWSSRALQRAAEFLMRLDRDYGGWAAEGDDQWQPWLFNHAYGPLLPAVTPARPGKIMGWTDWTLG